MHKHINGFRMNYEERGRGIPLLLIHGYPLNIRFWQPQLDDLAETARLVAPDLRGHGQSEAVPGPYSMDLLAADCAVLLDALGITRPVVVCGLSMGGYVSFAFYRQYPQRVAGLILAATRAAADSPEGKANRDKAADLARENGSAAIAASLLPKLVSPGTYAANPELVESLREILESTSLEGILGDLAGMKNRTDSTSTLPQIKVPTLILHGTEDQIVPLEEARAMQAAIPGAQLSVLPEAGHLINLEQPALFNAAVIEFLKALA